MGFDSPSRRDVLQGTASAVVGAVGLSSVAAADARFDYLDPVFTNAPLSVYENVGSDRITILDERTGGRIFQGPEQHDGRDWWYVQFSGDSGGGPVTGWVLDYGLTASDFICPLSGTVTSTYWDTRDGGSRYHRAVDISTSPSGGGQVVAAREGSVVIPPYDDGGYGNWLILQHPNGWETWYGHLRDFEVVEGEYVDRGEVIAIEGATGVGGAHLDFSVHAPGGGKYRSYYDVGETTVAGTGVPRSFF
ncbi:M23 family metallopeptidase [Haloarchaeobius baliensis]|uniref:M23 family metallopeptidase n=1 Tax=Haloarchaeobius baliensis TaxID=1670458 RepID=UPI003F88558A